MVTPELLEITESFADGEGCDQQDEPYFNINSIVCETPGGGGVPPSGTASMSTWWLWSGYHLSFNYAFGNTPGTLAVTGVSSNIVGVTMGVSWTQSNTQSFTNYPNSSLIYFDVSGYQNYNLIIEGIGTAFTQLVHLTGFYNTNTGTYTFNARN
jgi:hypothetical protein